MENSENKCICGCYCGCGEMTFCKNQCTIANCPCHKVSEKEPADWEKEFDNLPNTDMTTKEFIRQIRKELLERIEKLIVDEILICHEENTPTSRLTSLIMKIKQIENL